MISFQFRRIILLCIRVYQRIFSPDHGLLSLYYPHGYCRFYPSCSEYGYQAIQQKGLLFGSFRTLYRILRCNPFSQGGIDIP